jgi:hypothetical protein
MYMLHMAFAQAHSLLLEIKGSKAISFLGPKQRIAQDLVTPWRSRKQNNPQNGGLFQDIPVTCTLSNNPLVEIQNNKCKANHNNETTTSPKRKLAPVEEVLGMNMHSHMLMDNVGKMDTLCDFCKMHGVSTFVIYSCVKCKKGYYVNCYTVYHCTGALTGETVLSKMIIQTVTGNDRGSNNLSKLI